jgi:hypothetical protein
VLAIKTSPKTKSAQLHCEATHEKHVTPIAATQSDKLQENAKKRERVFTEIKNTSPIVCPIKLCRKHSISQYYPEIN